MADLEEAFTNEELISRVNLVLRNSTVTKKFLEGRVLEVCVEAQILSEDFFSQIFEVVAVVFTRWDDGDKTVFKKKPIGSFIRRDFDSACLMVIAESTKVFTECVEAVL